MHLSDGLVLCCVLDLVFGNVEVKVLVQDLILQRLEEREVVLPTFSIIPHKMYPVTKNSD